MEFKKLEKKLLGEMLIEEGYLQRAALEKALELQKKEGGMIGEILVKLGHISEEALVITLSKQLSIPFIHLDRYLVNKEAAQSITRETAEKFLVFPFDQTEHEMMVAAAYPQNTAALEAVEKESGRKVQCFLSTMSQIRAAVASQWPKEEPKEGRV